MGKQEEFWLLGSRYVTVYDPTLDYYVAHTTCSLLWYHRIMRTPTFYAEYGLNFTRA